MVVSKLAYSGPILVYGAVHTYTLLSLTWFPLVIMLVSTGSSLVSTDFGLLSSLVWSSFSGVDLLVVFFGFFVIVSCFLGVDMSLLNIWSSLVGVFGLSGVCLALGVFVGCLGALPGVLVGVFIQSGLRSRSRSMDIVVLLDFGGTLGASGLSLGLFKTHPFGGLTPRFGVVVIV